MGTVDDDEPTLEDLTLIENCLIEASNLLNDVHTAREFSLHGMLDARIDASLNAIQSWKELYDGRSNERPE